MSRKSVTDSTQFGVEQFLLFPLVQYLAYRFHAVTDTLAGQTVGFFIPLLITGILLYVYRKLNQKNTGFEQIADASMEIMIIGIFSNEWLSNTILQETPMLYDISHTISVLVLGTLTYFLYHYMRSLSDPNSDV